MKMLNANFTSKKNSKAASPVVLAVFHFNAGDVHVSDRTITAGSGSPVFNGLVTSWGVLSSPARGLFAVSMPEITLEISSAGTPSFASHLQAGIAEDTEVELFLWFDGLTYNEKEPLGRFAITSPVTYGSDNVKVALVSSFLKKNRVIGTKISREDYPNADPDVVGKTERIIYGQVKNVKCLPVVAGACSTLVSDINDIQTAGIELSLLPDEIAFPGSGFLQVGNEKMSYTGISSRILTGVSRGISGTTPAKHNKGTTVFEPRTDFTYQVAGHPVKNIGDVYVGGVRVATGVTKQTNSGGKANVILGNKFTVEKSVALSVSEGSHSHQNESWSGQGTRTTTNRWTASTNPNWTVNEQAGKAFNDSAGFYFFITANGSNYLDVISVEGRSISAGTYEGRIIRTQLENIHQDTVVATFNAPIAGTANALCDGAFNDMCNIIATTGYVDTKRGAALSDLGYIVGAKLCSMRGNATYSGIGKSAISGGIFGGLYSQGGGTTAQAYKATLSRSSAGTVPWSTFDGITIRATFVSGSAAASCSEQWVEVYYIPYGGGVSPATGVALSGNSTADIVVGGNITCDVDGFQDDVYGTYTGTPNSLIQCPSDVIKHFMTSFMGVPLAEIGTSFSSIRNNLAVAATGGYQFAGVVEHPIEALDFLEDLCSQSRINLAYNGYAASLEFLTNASAGADKTILMEQVKKSSLVVSRTGRDELTNKLEIHYKKDNSREGSARFLAVAASSANYPAGGDAGSIAAYGLRNSKMQCSFWFVDAQPMASDLRDFYITRYKDRKRRITFATFLDAFELEKGDAIGLDYSTPEVDLRGVKFFVEKVSFCPGSKAKSRLDEIHIQALEI